jgi:Cohesin loading factor
MPKASKPVSQPQEPVNYYLLLLSLAEECLEAARGMASTVALLRSEQDVEQYYRLMATAMGSMESILKTFRLAPRPEALLTLHYASLLYEETDNATELERYLRKGVSA